MSKNRTLEEQFIEADDLYDTALQWIENGEIKKAIELLKKVLALNKNFIYAYITLSEALSLNKDNQEALLTIEEAYKLDPEFDQLNYLLAKYSFKVGNYKKAKKHIEDAISLNPNDSLFNKAQKVILKYYNNN